MAGHIMTIVKNLLGDEGANQVGRIRMIKEGGMEVSISINRSITFIVRVQDLKPDRLIRLSCDQAQADCFTFGLNGVLTVN